MFITGFLIVHLAPHTAATVVQEEVVLATMTPTGLKMTPVSIPASLPTPTDPGPLPHEDAYIYIERDSMTISLYRDGDIYEKYPVASIRRIGSKYDTPTGLFTILTKEPNHFSSIGHVWMPYSMQFDGDFFIHGWPYYPDGTWVSPGYSGGCVRLLNVVAEAVYDFAYVGMPVLII